MADRSLALSFAAGLAPRTKAAVSPLGMRDVFGWVKESFPGAWQKGVTVDPIGNLTAFGAVNACLTLIASDIGKLALLLLDLGVVKTPAAPAAPHWKVLRKPNSYETPNQFLRRWVISKLLFGNTYVLKHREDARGLVTALHVLDPRRVTPMVTPEGDVYYSLGGDDLSKIPAGSMVPASEIIHDRCCAFWHPLIGVPPMYAAATSATQGRRIQSNSAKFFENMSRPSGMLTSPSTIPEDTAIRLKKDWEANYSGENIGRLAIGGDGLNYQPMTIPAEQAQLIEQLKWTAIDICGPFHVPPYKIGVGQMPTNNNVESLNLEYYSQCLQTHLEDIEGLLTEGLEIPTGKCVEFDLAALLRMDTAAQVEMLTKASGGAYMSKDEARAAQNLPPVPGGDSIYLQQQNFSLEALAKRDARDDPFAKNDPPAQAPAPAAPAPDVPPAQSESAKELAAFVERSTAAAQAQLDALAGIDRSVRASIEVAAATAEQSRAEALASKQAADLAMSQMGETMRAAIEAEHAKAAELVAAERAAIMAEVEKRLASAESVRVQREQEEAASAAFAAELIAKFTEAEVVCG